VNIALFTDEIYKEDFTRALDRAVEWGVSHVEVRAIDGERLPKVSAEVHGRFIAEVRDRGLAVSGLSPGFFKCDLDDPEVQATFDDALPRLCELMGTWDTNFLTCFSYKRREGESMSGEVIDRLGAAADLVAAAGCRLVLENVSACWGATGAESGEIVRQVGYDRLGLCWDPGNAGRGGADVPFPDDYETVKDLVDHVHVKNFIPDQNGWGLVDEGVVNWGAQVGALQTAGYAGFLVIETHLTERPVGRTAPPEGWIALEANTSDNLSATRACMTHAEVGA